MILLCEEEILVDGKELVEVNVLDDAEEIVEGKELVEGNEIVDAIELLEETVEEDIDMETDASDDVTSDVDEANKDESLEDRLGNGIEVHPVKIPVTQVNKMIG